jgi:alpha-L-rhamnosidase
MRLLDLLQHEEMVKVLIKYTPGITKFPGVLEMRTKSLKELADLQKANLSIDKVNALLEELNKNEWNLVSAK